MNLPFRLLWLALLPLLALISGCAGPAAVANAPNPPVVPQAFRATDPNWTGTTPAESHPRGQWWLAFADPVLSDLLQRAALANQDVNLAAARLAQARAGLRGARANQSARVNLDTSLTRLGGPLINRAGSGGNLVEMTLGASYEVDLFGRLAGASNAAQLDAQAREALLQSTLLMVRSDLTQTYFLLRALDAERALVRNTVIAYRESLRLMERRYAAGSVAELDVSRMRTELAEVRSELLTLDRRRSEFEHALALLVGDTASAFQLPEADWGAELPSIPPGIPSVVLARRPDVSAAQATVLAAQARAGAARTAWFPNLSLTASGGAASPGLGDLLRSSARAWGLGAMMALPLFDGGRRQAGVDNADAELSAALASYHQQVLLVFRDVEDQLSSLKILAEQAGVQNEALEAAARSSLLSDSRYRSGLVSQLELLDARRTELRHRRQALQVRSARYQATVGLIRALGGGWGASVTG